MSGCRSIGALLDGYYDGEIGPVDRWRVRRHASRCDACRSELDSLARLGSWVRTASPDAAAPDLWSAIAARLPAHGPRSVPQPRRARTWWWAPPVAGTLAAAGLAAVFLADPMRTDPAADGSPHGMVQSIFAPQRPVMVFEAEGAEDPTIIWLMDELGERTPETSVSVGV